ncbi:MAG: bifunctional precorrin-2 dehydrogenase/sirohydrochlorin ferrochelatase [Desulfonatronovibrionaceae bacterium]
MAYFPVFLDITFRFCLVAGAGRVGLRKIKTLSACGVGGIIVLDPSPDMEGILAASAEAQARPRILREYFAPKHLQGVSLVFACTPEEEENARIARICTEHRVFCNVATCDGGDMILPALLTRGELQIAVSTAGASPALSRRVREKLDREFGEEYALLASLLRFVRGPVCSLGLEQEKNAAIFRRLTEEDVLEALRNKDRQGLFGILENVLPDELGPEIGEMVHALV